MTERRVQVVPERWARPDEHQRKIVQATNKLLQGQGNNNFEVTLRANATTTEIPVSFAGPGQAVVLSPCCAEAAAVLATTYGISETGKVVIHHDALDDSDRLFQAILIG